MSRGKISNEFRLIDGPMRYFASKQHDLKFVLSNNALKHIKRRPQNLCHLKTEYQSRKFLSRSHL